MGPSRSLVQAVAALVLAALPLVVAHGDEMEINMPVNNTHGNGTSSTPVWEDFPPSYFRHSRYQGWMMLHVGLMIVAWVFAMPVAIMLSIARSRCHLPVQLVFHLLNGLALFAGLAYNRLTPDLYVNNAHHPMGWIVTCLSVVWTCLSVCSALNERRRKRPGLSTARHSMSAHNLGEYERLNHQVDTPSTARFSQDSGNFSESRTNSSESVHKRQNSIARSPGAGDNDDDADGFRYSQHTKQRRWLHHSKLTRFLSRHAKRFSGSRVSSVARLTQIVLEKFLLLLGFTTILTGFVTYGGIFRGIDVLSGLAHYIKGAIFFWYGLLTLGRWMGAFSEFGWAWNVRPPYPLVSRWKSVVPSAEFTESFVIWFYGASNVFLEHLEGGEWSPKDFEHISITVLFFGGGLLGMLIESQWIRSLLNTTVEVQKSLDVGSKPGTSRFTIANEAGVGPEGTWEPVNTEKTSLNPIPPLVIMLLGMMMSAHHQDSMVSTMMHKQWGMLFTGFAMARIATNIILYIKPPTSHFPARPPSELLAAFCLTSGGIMFMNSAGDSVRAIETNGLDAMTIFTITTGLTGLLMAWAILCFAIKGIAQRKERAATGAPLPKLG